MRRDEFPIIDKYVEQERQRIRDRVLEIIDDLCRDNDNGYVINQKAVYISASELRNKIKALGGGT